MPLPILLFTPKKDYNFCHSPASSLFNWSLRNTSLLSAICFRPVLSFHFKNHPRLRMSWLDISILKSIWSIPLLSQRSLSYWRTISCQLIGDSRRRGPKILLSNLRRRANSSRLSSKTEISCWRQALFVWLNVGRKQVLRRFLITYATPSNYSSLSRM